MKHAESKLACEFLLESKEGETGGGALFCACVCVHSCTEFRGVEAGIWPTNFRFWLI